MAGTGNILGVVELPSNWEHVGGVLTFPPSYPTSRPEPFTTVVLISSGLCHVGSATHPNAVGYMSLNSQKGNKLPGLRSYVLPFPILKAVEQFCVHWVLLFPLACSRH